MKNAVTIVKTGTTITTGLTSASVAIPTDSSGTIPKYCRLSATQSCYASVGVTGVTAVAGDILVNPNDAVIVRTHGLTYIAAIQVSAAGVLQISPVENM